jgi:hypothetical protein
MEAPRVSQAFTYLVLDADVDLTYRSRIVSVCVYPLHPARRWAEDGVVMRASVTLRAEPWGVYGHTPSPYPGPPAHVLVVDWRVGRPLPLKTGWWPRTVEEMLDLVGSFARDEFQVAL